jgi:DNA-binding transcriptional regulator YhcF (GntR family)
MKEIIIYSNHIHSFSRVFASKYGVNAALVLSYIGFRIGVSKNERDGKYWFYDTLDEIARQYPYLGRSAIYEAIQRLTTKNGPLIVGHFNKRKGDRTNWYAFRHEITADLLKRKPLYFKVEDAVIYGVPAAVLLNNLAYHILKKRKEMPHFRFQALSASGLAAILPFSRSTIQRALKSLVEEGVLLYRTTTDTTLATEYCFAHTEDLEEYAAGSGATSTMFEELAEVEDNAKPCCTVRNGTFHAEPIENEEDTHEKAQKTGAGPNPNRPQIAELPVNPILTKIKPAQARIQQMVGSNPNKAGSKANELGSNPNDYTILINPLERLFEKDSLKRCDLLETRKFADDRILSLSDSHKVNHSTILSQKPLDYS